MSRGYVAAGNEDTARAAQAVLDAGGNAVDAVIAATLMASASEAACISLGGGGFLNIAKPGEEPELLDFFVQTPAQKIEESKLDFFDVKIQFDADTQTFHIGAASMAIPGLVKGLWQAHSRWGHMPMKELSTPAIKSAKEGCELDSFQAELLRLLEPVTAQYEAGRKLFQSDGKQKTQGQKVSMPELADTLDLLAHEGPDEFYKGEIAARLVNYCKSKGGHISMQDLQNYEVITRKPFCQEIRGHKVYMNPPPAAGGLLVAFGLQLLSEHFIDKVKADSAEELAILTQALMLTKDFRESGQTKIAADFIDQHFQTHWLSLAERLGCTTHISVLDEAGMAASLTMSCGVGSGYYIPGTGIMINNMLGESDLLTKGFHSWTPNERLPSMMNPTIVKRQNEVALILGSGGSNRIRSAILQVLYRSILQQEPLQKAIYSPRIHLEGNTLEIESGINPDYLEKIQPLFPKLRLNQWNSTNMYFGGVHAIAKSERGVEAIGDPRRNGVPKGH